MVNWRWRKKIEQLNANCRACLKPYIPYKMWHMLLKWMIPCNNPTWQHQIPLISNALILLPNEPDMVHVAPSPSVGLLEHHNKVTYHNAWDLPEFTWALCWMAITFSTSDLRKLCPRHRRFAWASWGITVKGLKMRFMPTISMYWTTYQIWSCKLNTLPLQLHQRVWK